MNAYFISGLGADRRVFSRLKLPPEVNIHHIEWIEPLKNESLSSYCLRLKEQIKDDSPCILVGLSFGGLVAIELQKILKVRRLILISSISTRKELPFYFRLPGLPFLQRHIPASWLTWPSGLIYYFFNAKRYGERLLLKEFMRKVSGNYLKWSIQEVLKWENIKRPENMVHIHGASDRIFPSSLVQADHLIKNGGHLMVYDRAREMSELISSIMRQAMEEVKN
jgi:pimeloyl-ACP methyl ester carboxylesterase